MNIKQKTGVLAWVILAGLLSVAAPFSASADPQTSSVKCLDGKTVQVNKAMKPDANVLDDKDNDYACRNNGGYKSIDETIVCKDGEMHNVYKSNADPKDKLTQEDRVAACRNFGGIKPEETDDDGTATTNPIAGSDCAGVKTAIIKCDADNSGEEVNNNGIWALLMMVLNIMTAGIGILAVGGIVYGAILYTTAEDKADQVKKATGIITNVVIGLILYAFMWAGLNFIVPGGIFA